MALADDRLSGHPPALIAPAGDDAYGAAHLAVVDAFERGEHTPNAHVLAGAAVTAAAPYLQAAVVARMVHATAWRTSVRVWLQVAAPALGLLVAIAYAMHVGSLALALVELVLFGLLLRGTQLLESHTRTELDRAQQLLGGKR